MLAGAAVDAGARLLTARRVTACRDVAHGWEVGCADGSSWDARVLVDATGRRAGPGRALGARRLAFDRLVAVCARWPCAESAAGRFLLLEAAPEGWWYTAPVPGGEMVGMLMTDADLCREGRWADATGWQKRLRATAVTAARAGDARPVGSPAVHPAASARLHRAGDERPWLAVGDAALAVDPVSGGGVLGALRTALQAAAAVERLLDRPGDAAAILARYEAERDRDCTGHLVRRAEYYAMVRRFRTPFWSRRHVPPAGAARRAG
jgi:flavin-dependent dehydrogenase